ncbi:MAG: chorismate mutase [Candidatus Zixiibacteriota bacterium]|nr:MAG: chorismate mutase [candidate division Zixibacteria bacterium]
MSKKEIDKIRKGIDKIDLQLLYLFNRRAELVLEMAKTKVKIGEKLFDPKRERDVFVSITEKNPGPLSPDAIVRLYERIIDESRRLERTEVYDKEKE